MSKKESAPCKAVECKMENCFANREENCIGYCQILIDYLDEKKRDQNCPFYKSREFKKAQELMLYGESSLDQKSYMLD